MTRQQRHSDEAIYLSRRMKFLKLIRGELAIFVTPPEVNRSRDQVYPYDTASDFFYLTGFAEPRAILVLCGLPQGPRSLLYLQERDALHERWNGERLGLKRARKRFRVDEVRDIVNFEADLSKLLLNTHVLHYTPGIHAHYDQVIWKEFSSTVAPRFQRPNIFKDARLITSEMRFVKDKFEIQSLRHAADITARGFLQFLPHAREMTSERHAAETLESVFAKLGAHGLAFATIVASGRNATTLHHQPGHQPLWKRELVLVDAGASYRGYAGDITRTFPVNGKFTSPQAEIYDLVESAVTVGTSKAKPNSTLDDIHEAVVKHLTKGLIDLRLLKGTVSEVISSGGYKKYFMHRTGHWLGLDVHDISPITLTNSAGTTLYAPASIRPLVPGNAFTIEPGLYFDPRDPSIPEKYRGIGIRVEEDILITPTDCEVLTSSLPRKRTEIEELLA